MVCEVGRMGVCRFSPGLYTYTGSAVGVSTNLRTRVSRHLAREKKTHWHIDYILSGEVSRVRAVIFVESSLRAECEVALDIERLSGASIVIRGFGASDCHSECSSHLHYFRGLVLDDVLSEIIGVYKKVFGDSLPCIVLVE